MTPRVPQPAAGRPRGPRPGRPSEKLSMADRLACGNRWRYRFRIASVVWPMNSSITRWSTPAAARFEAKLCR